MAGRKNTKPSRGQGYQLVENPDDAASSSEAHQPEQLPRRTFKAILIALLTCLVILLGFKLALDNGLLLNLGGKGTCPCPTSDVPQYFQTSPELWAGPTPTGKAPFLAQTVTFDPTATYVPNTPLQTAIPIQGMGSNNKSIFQLMGYLSPYSPSPGFVNEYPVPPGADIVQVQVSPPCHDFMIHAQIIVDALSSWITLSHSWRQRL
jgi:hypothetical protein